MPDLRQVLKDFVATSNSGKYATEQELLSKFPELKGYNPQVLRDFVATNNSGKYKTEDELFSKFPEFNLGGAMAPKKKVSLDSEQSQQPQAKAMASSSEDGSLGTQKKFRLAKEDDLEVMQKRGILPPPSELPLSQQRSVNPEDLYDLQAGKPESKKKFAYETEKIKIPGQRTAQKLILKSKITDKKAQDLVDNFVDNEQTGEIGYGNQYLISEAKEKIRKTDSDLENPYVYYSVQKQKENPDNFLSENYNTQQLTEMGINLEDFDGFLNKKGYKNDFLKKKSRGLFEGKGEDITGYDIQLADELAKKRMLDLYIEDKYNRDFVKQDLNQDILIASGDIKEKSFKKNQLFDSQKTLSYIENNFPTLTKKLKERDEENAKLYNEAKSGGTDFFSWDTVDKLGKSGWNAITDRVNQFTASAYDVIGAEDTAEGIRMLDEQEKLLRPNNRGVSYVSGKKVEDNGVNYIVDSKGEIYDADSKIIVTDLFDEQKYNSIVEQSKTGEDGWIFSTQGAAVQTSAVVADMLLQAALTKGMGTGGAISSGTRGALSSSSKVASVLNDTSKLLRKIPIERGVGYSMMAQGALGYSEGYEETLKAAREAGINDDEAFELAANAGQRMAVLYSTTGVINPQTNVVKNVFGSKNIIKKAIEQYSKTGKKGFVGYIDDVIKNTPRNLVDIAEEGGKEVVQENIQQLGELGVNAMTNADAKKKIANEVMSGDDFMNTSILSFISSGLISKAKLPTLFRNDNKDDLTSLSVLSKNRDKIDGVLDNLVSKNVFTKDEALKLKEDVDIYTRNVNKLPKSIPVDVAMPVMRDLDKIQKLKDQKQNIDKVFHDDIDNQISLIENNIKELLKPKQDAVQEQSTTEVPVQSETGISETMEGRTPEAEPQVVTEQITQEEEIADPLRDVESTANALNEDLVSSIEETANMLFPKSDETNNIVAEAYHKAKQDGSNPELVDAVESLLTPEVKPEELTAEEKIINERQKELNSIRTDSRFETRAEEDAFYEESNKIDRMRMDLKEERDIELEKAETDAEKLEIRKKYDQKLSDVTQSRTLKLKSPLETEQGKAEVKAERDAVIAKYDKQLKDLEKPKETIPDEVSQPIELSVAPEATTEVPPPAESTAEKIKGGDNLSDTFLNDKQLTYQESFDLANSELKEIEAKERTLPVQKEYEGKIQEINRIKELATKSSEAKAEVAPVEEKFIIDGKEYTKEEALDKARYRPSITYGSKMEYNGNDAQAKEFVDRYNEESSPYFRDGRLKGGYIKQELLKAMNSMSFRKFGNLYRKHIDPYFSRASNEKSVGGYVGKDMTFEELAGYIIGDSNPDTFEEKDFRAFAKEAGIDIPEFQTAETKTEVVPAETAPETKKSDSKFSKEDLIETLNSLGGQVIIEEEAIGYRPKDSNLYYWFKEQYNGNWNNVSYTWSNSRGKMKSGLRGLDLKTKVREARKTKLIKAEAEVTPVEELNNLLDVDTKDENGLKRVYDFLDGLDTALDLDPNELNDVTRVMAIATAKAVVKALKALVKAGMTLQEAIKQVASDENLKVSDVLKGINALSEISKIAPGYDALMEKADKLIARQKAKGIAEKKIVSNLDTMIRQSDVYLNANDAQKKIMEREARAKMGITPKKAVSIGRVIGALKDIRNVSRAEKLKIISRIRELSRDAAKDLVEEIRELAKGGKITPAQSINIISKFGKVNMLNESSVSNFVDYMAKVFADADYDNKISVAKSKLKNAKKNIATKIGIANGLRGPLQTLMSINPNLIPSAYLNRYLELVNMFAERKAVLTLEEIGTVTNDVNDILNEINNEQSLLEELTHRFENSPSLVSENGIVNYSETIADMLKNNEITQDEADLMKKYKSTILPKVSKPEMTEQEIQDEKDALVAIAKRSQVNTADLPTRAERDLAKKLASLIKTKWINELSNLELQNLLKVIDNINNGYIPHYAQLISEKIESLADGALAEGAIKKSKFPRLSTLYAKLKSKITRKDYVLEMIRRSPLEYIDQVFGDFKTKDLFNAILKKSAEAEAKFTSEIKAIHTKLRNAEYNIAKSFNFNANSVVMSKFKMMTYMIQLEYESNKDSSQVNPASEYLKKTIEHINSLNTRYNKDDAKMLETILADYSTDGEIDINKLYNSFNKAEKAAIKTIRGINESLTETAQFTASVIRGQKMNPLNNYVHLNTLADTREDDLNSGQSLADSYNNSLQPSTKAKSLIERTKGAKPLNFDIFASAERGAKYVLMDYHLTGPIRTARKAINKAISAIEQEGPVSEDRRRVMNAVRDAFKEAVSNLVNSSYMETSFGEQVADEISKQGYRAVLASTGRFASEFLSNVGFVLFYGAQAFSKGLKHFDVMMSDDAVKIMSNLNSKEINRIFPSDTLSGRMIDQGILNQTNGISRAQSKGAIRNRASQAWNLIGKKYKNRVELISDILITTPDKAIMRPVWFGNFASEFEKLTGREMTKEDFNKIAENNEQYMDANKEILEKAKTVADEKSVITGASSNAFTGILKGTSNPKQKGYVKAFNNFNSFMTRFLIYEYTSARTGINAAVGNGTMSKKEGAALLAAVTTRMTVYSLLTKALGEGLIGLLFGSDDDDEEEKKSLEKATGQALASTFTSLIFGRDFGNATKTIINYGIEKINENHLQALREGEYDPYEDQIQYTAVPVAKGSKAVGLYDYAKNMAGAFGPAINTTDLAIRTYFGEDKKEADAQERRQKEKEIRVPLEIAGNLGFIPLYKEIRKAVMKDIYKGLSKPVVSATAYEDYKEAQEEKVVLDSIIDSSYDQDIIDAAEKKKKELMYKGTEYQKAINKLEKEKKKELLVDPETGTKYDNEEDLKKYNRTLWEQNFGPNSDWEQEHKYEDAVDKMVRDAATEKEERKYNYVKPK